MDNYNAEYPSAKTDPMNLVVNNATLIKLKCEQLRLQKIVDAGKLDGKTYAQLLEAIQAALGGGSSDAANYVAPLIDRPVKTYQVANIPGNNGSASNASVPVLRLQIHGPGFESSQDQASARCRMTVKCLDMIMVVDYVILRSGDAYRIDYQGYLYGGSGSLDYYAISRGSMILPQGVLDSTGYLAWSNLTSEDGRHNHMAINNDQAGLPDNDNPSDQVEPLSFSGTPYYGRAGTIENGVIITQLAVDGKHDHTVTAAYKIKTTGHDSAVDCHAETGAVSERKITPVWYLDGATAVGNHYSQNSASNYLELRITGIPIKTGWTPVVETTVEMIGNNHKVWFYDSERVAWQPQPVVGVLGDSIAESADLGDSIYYGTSAAPYGGVYRFLWTEQRGYWNFGVGGHRTDQMLTRIQLAGGDIAMKRLDAAGADTGWLTRGCTHVIVCGGINDCIRSVLYGQGLMLSGDTYDSAWTFQPLANIQSIIDVIESATAREVTPVVLISPRINAAAYQNKSGSTLAVVTTAGAAAGNTTLAQWEAIAELWDVTAMSIRSYCISNRVKYIDWYYASQLCQWDTKAGGHSWDGIHPNLRGYNFLARFADIA